MYCLIRPTSALYVPSEMACSLIWCGDAGALWLRYTNAMRWWQAP